MPQAQTPPLAFLQKPLEGTVDAILGALGLDNPGKRTIPNEAAQLLAAALPIVAAAVAKGGLTMTKAARLSRAAEQGFDTGETVYHGSNRAFSEFENRPTFRNVEGGPKEVTSQAHFFSTDRNTSKTYAKDKQLIDQRLRGQSGGRPNVREFYLKSEQPLDLTISDDTRRAMMADGYSPHFNPNGINPYALQELEDVTGYTPETWNDVQALLDDPHVVAALRDMGYDSVRLREMNLPGDTIAVFAPNQIRSTKAAFDPRKAGSGNIMAALAGLLATGAATAKGDR